MRSFHSSLAHKGIIVVAAITSLNLAELPLANAQMNINCEGKGGYQRLASWIGGETGYGGYYETEICGLGLGKSNGQAEIILEVRGKDGSGKGIFSMNCANAPKGYWASRLTFYGYFDEVKRNMPKALRQAAKLYC